MDHLSIPKGFSLPFWGRIRIKLVPPKDIHLFDEETGEQLDGLWLEDEKTMYINKSLPPRKLRYLILHETMHCVADWQHDMFLMNRAKPTGG